MNNPAQRVRTAFAALLLTTSVPSGGWSEWVADYHGDNFHTLDTQLVVSPPHVHMTIAENECEADGIQKIVELMRNSQVEVMWVYVPDAGSPDICQWIEIGRGKYGGRAEQTTVKVDREYLSELMARHPKLHLYHFHPLAYFERCTGERRCADLPVPMTADGLSERGSISNLRYAMPSPIDIAFMMDVSQEFDQHHHDDAGRMRNRVVTPYGIVDYSLTEEGKKRLENDGMEEMRGRWGFDTYIITWVSYALSDTGAIIKRHPKDMIEALKDFARSLSNEYLLVTYTPF